jgi:hypothetical protein
MARPNFTTQNLDIRGFGHQGYCKLCSLKDGRAQAEYNARVREKWSPRQLNEWCETRGIPEMKASHVTIRKHRDHVMHPQDKIVNAVQRAEKQALQTAPVSSPDLFLESLVSIGMQRVADRPDDVTLDQALKAATTIKQSKDSAKSGLAELIKLMTTLAPTVRVIEGDAVEVLS